MCNHSLSHLSDRELVLALSNLVAQDRTTTAVLLAHLAEVESRKLYLPAAHHSMFSYCVRELRFSEDMAYKRIRAARAARRFPWILDAIADGRLHVAAVVVLKPYLTPSNVRELLESAEHKTKAEVEKIIAERFPKTESLPLVCATGPSVSVGNGKLVPGPVADPASAPELVPGLVGALDYTGQADVAASNRKSSGPPSVAVASSHETRSAAETPGAQSSAQKAQCTGARLSPLAPQRYALQLSIPQSMRDKLKYAQELASHQIPSGDLVEILERSLDAYIAKLEKTKFSVTDKPRAPRASSSLRPRAIPSAVKRAVWERDGGQCTFVSEDGKRCESRRFIEYDHVDPVARGGRGTVDGLQLRCRAHNQYSAECTFGAGFMEEKREAWRMRSTGGSQSLRANG